MKLALTCADSKLWASLILCWPELERCKQIPDALSASAGLLVEPQSAQQLAELVQLSGVSVLVVFYSQAEYAIAEQLQQGECDLVAAAARWQSDTEALLAIQRKNRQLVKLVNLQQAINQPKALQHHLTQLGMPTPQSTIQCSAVSAGLLASCQFVRQQPELTRVNTMLQASALPLGETTELNLDLDAFLQAETALQAEYHFQRQAHQQESELLLHQLGHVQEELEQLFQKKLDVKLKYSSLKEEYEREVASLQGDLKVKSSAMQMTKNKLADVQKELDRIANEHNSLREQVAASATTQQERDLLFGQLLQVQEALELYQRQASQQQLSNQAELDSLRSELSRQTKQLQRELSKAQQQLKLTEARLAQANYHESKLSIELAEIKRSSLWKAVAPVRRLSLKRQTPEQRELQRNIALLMTSDWFDLDWYLSRNPDVASSGMNPAEHYLKFGYQEGRMPSPRFDGNWYLQRYPDVAESGVNPLIHFIKFGLGEGRQASPILISSPAE